MRLEKDHGCRTGLAWRCDIRPGALTDALIDAFDDAGVPLKTESFGLATFEEMDTKHRVIVVVATGRVQVRLDYTTPHDARPDEATRVGVLLGRVFETGNAL